MASLTGTKIKDTYDALLKVSDNGALDGTLQTITDGLGNNSSLSLSTAGASVGGTLAVSGAATLSSTLGVSGAATLSGGVNGNTTFSGNLTIGSSSVGKNINTYSSSYGSNGVHSFYGTDDNLKLQIGGLSNDLSFLYSPSGVAMSFFAGAVERMKIHSGGDVSFRDSSANEAFYWDASAAKLSVVGSASSNGVVNIDNAVNQADVNHGTLNIRNTASYALGNDASIMFSAKDSLGIMHPRASIGMVVSGGAQQGDLVFNTRGASSAERMRITSGGYLKASSAGSYVNVAGLYHELIGNADSSHAAQVANSSATSPYGLTVRFPSASPNNTSNRFIDAEDSTGLKFIVYSNGNVVNTNNSYGAISDAKLKENVVDASPKLEDLMQVQVRNFNYIGDDKKQLGVVAQELEQVFPSMIDESPDFEEVEVPQLDENGQEVLDENGEVVMTKEKVDLGTVTKSVKYSVFVPMLIKAIQELNAKVESLEAQLNA
jgi:hypothetical protein